MLEPVGGKLPAWHMGETLKCPTDQYPYIFTNKNSAQALEEYQRSTMAQTTPRASPTSSSRPHASSPKHHKHHKHDRSFNNIHLAAIAGGLFIVLVLLICACNRRQQIRVFIHGTGRRHINGFDNPKYPDESDES